MGEDGHSEAICEESSLLAFGEHLVALGEIGSESWLAEKFPEKDWHRHPRTDGRSDLCDGTPSDCAYEAR